MSAIRISLVLAALALMGLVALGFNAYRTSLDSLERLNQERLTWSSSQLQIEYLRFTKSLEALRAHNAGATASNVNSRFDILWSRMAVTQQGVVGERLRNYDRNSQVLDALWQTMNAQEQAIVGLSDGDDSAVTSIQSAFAKHDAAMRDFNRLVYFGEEVQTAEIRTELFQSSMLIAIGTALTFIVGSVLVFLVSRESRLHHTAAEHNARLATAAEKANRAKSSFLTMMSHELRTPMNGVLGMLAMTKETGVGEKQLRLIDQAEASGQQMISMLGDILDYAALQDDKMDLAKKPFEPKQLSTAVAQLFGAEAQREGIAFTARCAPDCPRRLVGDFRRLRQVIAHFASYIVETAGTKDVDILISHNEPDLLVTISFVYGADETGEIWHPDIILGAQSGDVGKFASDALGPAVAREILERMNGQVRLDYGDGDRIAIVLSAPAPVIEIDAPVIHIETVSQSLNTICRVALAGGNFEIYDPENPSTVHIVLMEVGGQNEAENLKRISQLHPNALIFSIGKAISPSDFDGHIDTPLIIADLQKALSEKIAV